MRRRTLAALALVLAAAPALAQNPSDPAAMKATALLADVFIAINAQNPEAVKKVLDAGADVNGRNWLGITPLMWAATRGDQKVVDLLLARGAKINDPSIYGNAATFAAIGRHGKLTQYLLSKGAAQTSSRVDKGSLLMFGAANGDAELISRVLSQKADPNTRDQDGATALIYGARNGHSLAVQKLLKAGAKVDTVDAHGRSALSYAAQNGHPKVAAQLIAARSRVNLRDKTGATPLLLAARYNGDAATIRSLIRAGADTKVRDSRGKSAFELANSREYTEAAGLLKAGSQKAVAISNTPAPDAREAVQRGVNIVQSSLSTFAKRAECGSCHHQGLGLTAVLEAKKHGFKTNDQLIGQYMQQIAKEGQTMGPAIHQALTNPAVGRSLPAVDIDDFSVGLSYFFGSLASAGVPPNPGLGEAAQFLGTMQNPAGYWSHGFERGQMQNSFVTTTALTLRILRTYGNEEQLKTTFEKARQYLNSTPMKHSADLASRLIGLKWAGADSADIEKASSALLKAQKPDGGWSSIPNGRSDAYGTGLALYALNHGKGMPAADPVYQRGIRYLVRTQDEDGSWYLNKAAMPANNYFDAGFPHGESQYASFAATAWATMAMMPAAQSPQTAGR